VIKNKAFAHGCSERDSIGQSMQARNPSSLADKVEEKRLDQAFMKSKESQEID
jgi:hypothetical protein